MKSIGILLLLISGGSLGVNGFEVLEESLDYELAEPRFFNLSVDGIFNNSLLTLGGIFVLGVILFGIILSLFNLVSSSSWHHFAKSSPFAYAS